MKYELSKDDLRELLTACRPTPVMFLDGGQPLGNTQQENANAAWAHLGKKMGFNPLTVRPIPGQHARFFTADAIAFSSPSPAPGAEPKREV